MLNHGERSFTTANHDGAGIRAAARGGGRARLNRPRCASTWIPLRSSPPSSRTAAGKNRSFAAQRTGSPWAALTAVACYVDY